MVVKRINQQGKNDARKKGALVSGVDSVAAFRDAIFESFGLEAAKQSARNLRTKRKDETHILIQQRRLLESERELDYLRQLAKILQLHRNMLKPSSNSRNCILPCFRHVSSRVLQQQGEGRCVPLETGSFPLSNLRFFPACSWPTSPESPEVLSSFEGWKGELVEPNESIVDERARTCSCVFSGVLHLRRGTEQTLEGMVTLAARLAFVWIWREGGQGARRRAADPSLCALCPGELRVGQGGDQSFLFHL